MSYIYNIYNMRILELKTIQCIIFKTLIEALKEIVFDVNIQFTEHNIKIMKMDHSHTIVAILDLDTSKFESYKCERIINNQRIPYTDENPLVIGINILYLFKLLKNLSNDDILSLIIDDDNSGYLEIIIQNTNKNFISKYNLNLIELNEETLIPKKTDYNNVVTFNSVNFQKLIKEMNLLSKIIEIKYYNKQLIFSCKGDFASQETILTDKTEDIKFYKEQSDEIYQSYFKAKTLLSFNKFTNLCSHIKLYLKNEYPLLLEYSIGTLGKIKIYVSQTSDKK